MTALIFGASGLVGNELLTILLANSTYSIVKIVVRKALDIKSPKLQQIVADYTNIESKRADLKADHVFCCLGSTRKKTPDLKSYYQIDHDYPVLAAKILFKEGAKSFHIISAMGANKTSSIFYSKMKGEVEKDILNIGFESTHIYRPGLIIGNRTEKRTLEKLAEMLFKAINPLLVGSLKKYQSIPSKTIATAMYNQSLSDKKGEFIYQSDKIKELT